MNKRSFLSACLVCCVAVSTIGCGSMPFGKSTKNPAPVKEAGVSKIEWGARNWEYYAKDNNGVTHYMDKSAISYPSKYIIHVWRRRVFPEAAPGSKSVRSSHKEIIAYDEMNCKTEKYRALESQGGKLGRHDHRGIHKTDAVDAHL